MPATLDSLLSDLESTKNNFQPGLAGKLEQLLEQLSRFEFRDAKSLIRFHEALLFFRAFPPWASLIPPIEHLLDTFQERVGKLREFGTDMAQFDDFDTSGIAGTTMQDALNFEAARWLVSRIPRNVEVAWDDYDDERAMGSAWPHLIPLLEEDADVEANIPWRRWLDAARGRKKDALWLLRQFEQLSVEKESRLGAETYDSLRLPVRWRLANLKFSRTRNWHHPRRFFFHTEPLITRKQVSLADELGRPLPALRGVSLREGEAVMQTIREVMLVRYRELYGTTLGDACSVVRAEVGRGVVIYLWNLPAARRLPLRAYVAGFTVKNGVPINYIEAIGLCDWIEVGFNTFYTYRQGETAWAYAQALRCLCALTGAKTISVYPYQIGQNNDEALDSGAFWFYRKLGFRSGKPELEELAKREESTIVRNPKHRTSRRVLKRLAEAHVFYELEPTAAPGPWDQFSTRNLGLRVNRRMAKDFGGEAKRIREASVAQVAQILHLNPRGWTTLERCSLQNWSLVLALMPGLAGWSTDEKRRMAKIIRSQAGTDEMRYLYLTQHHEKLRAELLRLGSG